LLKITIKTELLISEPFNSCNCEWYNHCFFQQNFKGGKGQLCVLRKGEGEQVAIYELNSNINKFSRGREGGNYYDGV
jgi:hypothetical protein